MNRLGKVLSVATIAIAIVLAAGLLYAGDHPERATGSGSKVAISRSIENSIEKYVKSESALKGGFFLIYDTKTREPLVLTLAGVHRESIAKVGRDEYFACADFKTQQGKIYDLDMVMKGSDKNNLQIAEISVHKEAGRARYKLCPGYLKGKKCCKTKPLGGAEKGSASKKTEHPEHPK